MPPSDPHWDLTLIMGRGNMKERGSKYQGELALLCKIPHPGAAISFIQGGLLVPDGWVAGCVRFPPARAQKLQLAVEQLLTTGTHQKNIMHVQRQRKSHSKMVGGAQSQKIQIPYPPVEWPTDWRTIIPKKFSYFCEGSEPHVRPSSLGIQQRDWESPGNLVSIASGIWL